MLLGLCCVVGLAQCCWDSAVLLGWCSVVGVVLCYWDGVVLLGWCCATGMVIAQTGCLVRVFYFDRKLVHGFLM